MSVRDLGVMHRQTIQGGVTVKTESISASLNKPMAVVWFDIGQKIKDANGQEHPMTVAAKTRLEYEDCIKKGWKPIVEDVTAESLPSNPAPVFGVTSRKKK